MKKVGVTGQNGFIGYHLINTLKLFPSNFEIIDFQRSYFNDKYSIDQFVKSCDVIVHLAALNRHNDPEAIYNTNTGLVEALRGSLIRTSSKTHLIISSSSQEERDNIYGKSKRDARLILSNWAKEFNGRLTGLIIPNVFGPFGQPYYNSVVATFCHQVSHGEEPKIEVDGLLKLIYVGDLVQEIIEAINSNDNTHELKINHRHEAKVSEILTLINYFHDCYFQKGEIPKLESKFEHQLFNTFRCYLDVKSYFPKKFIKHEDERGAFVEIARLGISGQTSFSTTQPGVTRGNHFHTRKIERFAVIKGKAKIELRRVGTDEVLSFDLDGEMPAYVDMPIWYTHNIKNIGSDELYTIFWIDEPYNPLDSDTYFETV